MHINIRYIKSLAAKVKRGGSGLCAMISPIRTSALRRLHVLRRLHNGLLHLNFIVHNFRSLLAKFPKASNPIE